MVKKSSSAHERKESKYFGVHWNRSSRKWRAQRKFKGKKYHGGMYTNELDCAKASDRLVYKFGQQDAQWIRLNFPPEKSGTLVTTQPTHRYKRTTSMLLAEGRSLLVRENSIPTPQIVCQSFSEPPLKRFKVEDEAEKRRLPLQDASWNSIPHDLFPIDSAYETSEEPIAKSPGPPPGDTSVAAEPSQLDSLRKQLADAMQMLKDKDCELKDKEVQLREKDDLLTTMKARLERTKKENLHLRQSRQALVNTGRENRNPYDYRQY
jgi:hypothetical protein